MLLSVIAVDVVASVFPKTWRCTAREARTPDRSFRKRVLFHLSYCSQMTGESNSDNRMLLVLHHGCRHYINPHLAFFISTCLHFQWGLWDPIRSDLCRPIDVVRWEETSTNQQYPQCSVRLFDFLVPPYMECLQKDHASAIFSCTSNRPWIILLIDVMNKSSPWKSRMTRNNSSKKKEETLGRYDKMPTLNAKYVKVASFKIRLENVEIFPSAQKTENFPW